MVQNILSFSVLFLIATVTAFVILSFLYDTSEKKKYSVGDIVEFQEKDQPIKVGIIVKILKAIKYYKRVGSTSKPIKEDSMMTIVYSINIATRRLDSKNIEVNLLNIAEEDIIRKVA